MAAILVLPEVVQQQCSLPTASLTATFTFCDGNSATLTICQLPVPIATVCLLWSCRVSNCISLAPGKSACLSMLPVVCRYMGLGSEWSERWCVVMPRFPSVAAPANQQLTRSLLVIYKVCQPVPACCHFIAHTLLNC